METKNIIKQKLIFPVTTPIRLFRRFVENFRAKRKYLISF